MRDSIRELVFPASVTLSVVAASGLLELPCPVNQQAPLLVVDSNVYEIYAEKINLLVTYENRFIVPSGESSKCLDIYRELIHWFYDRVSGRDQSIIALGGGVVGDLAGFAAATYLRGIPFHSYPTTVLSQVDSCLGGKVGINLKHGKNLLGCFYHPQTITLDPFILMSLDERNYRSGLVEAFKYVFIGDSSLLFSFRENKSQFLARDEQAMVQLVRRCLGIKYDVVKADQYESGERMKLNLGHTLAHAIEASFPGRFLHGEAVFLGILFSLYLSHREGMMSTDDYLCSVDLFRDLLGEKPSGFFHFQDHEVIFRWLERDKKVRRDGLCFVFPRAPGRCEVKMVSVATIKAGLISFFNQNHVEIGY